MSFDHHTSLPDFIYEMKGYCGMDIHGAATFVSGALLLGDCFEFLHGSFDVGSSLELRLFSNDVNGISLQERLRG